MGDSVLSLPRADSIRSMLPRATLIRTKSLPEPGLAPAGMIRPLVKSLDVLGGVVPTDLQSAREADLITLPEGIAGTNCGNCRFIQPGEEPERMCNHPMIMQKVNEKNCCALWDAEGVIRVWANGQQKPVNDIPQNEKALSAYNETAGGALASPPEQKRPPGYNAFGTESLKTVELTEEEKGLLTTVQAAGEWLADAWIKAEDRYGRAGALSMAVAGLATMPLPGNIAAIIGIAEAIRGMRGKSFPGGVRGGQRNLGTVPMEGTVDQVLDNQELVSGVKAQTHKGEPCKQGWTAARTGCQPATGKPVEESQEKGEEGESWLNVKPVNKRPLKGGTMDFSELVTFADGKMGIRKPSKGEKARLDNIPVGTYYKREAAAFDIAKELGFSDLIPETVVDESEDPASVQEFVPGEIAMDLVEEERFGEESDLARAAVLDFLIGNADRQPGNWIVGDDGKLKLIDNGLTFPEDHSNWHRMPHDLTEKAAELQLKIPEEFSKKDWQPQNGKRSKKAENAVQSVQSKLGEKAAKFFGMRLDEVIKKASQGKSIGDMEIRVK